MRDEFASRAPDFVAETGNSMGNCDARCSGSTALAHPSSMGHFAAASKRCERGTVSRPMLTRSAFGYIRTANAPLDVVPPAYVHRCAVR